MSPTDALAVGLVAFIAGLAVGLAAQKHQSDKADLQRQIWNLKKATSAAAVRTDEGGSER